MLVNRLLQCAPMGATSQAGVMTAEWTPKTLVGNAGVWVQWLLGDRAHAKSVNHSIWKMNGMFWSSLPVVSGEWPVRRQAQQAGAEVSADVISDNDLCLAMIVGDRSMLINLKGHGVRSGQRRHPKLATTNAEEHLLSVRHTKLSPRSPSQPSRAWERLKVKGSLRSPNGNTMREVERDGDSRRSSRAGRVPRLLRQAMLEEEVTGRGASLKLAAPGE
eukprot:superscaffoldBa00000467_g4934